MWSAIRADSSIACSQSIERTGYGLTLGIHSRIDDTVEDIDRRLQVGNIYVNRNMIGAVVGVQPFGGHGLSGTGPKAGGPHYLARFATEQTVTVNTAAAGGNAALLSGMGCSSDSRMRSAHPSSRSAHCDNGSRCADDACTVSPVASTAQHGSNGSRSHA